MRQRSRLLLGAALLAGAGCTRWEHVRPVPHPVAAADTFRAARVTYPRGGMIVLRNVEVTADSVIGWRQQRQGELVRVSLHRSQVLVLDRRVPDWWATAGASVLALVGAWAVAAWYALSHVKV